MIFPGNTQATQLKKAYRKECIRELGTSTKNSHIHATTTPNKGNNTPQRHDPAQ